MCSILHRTGEFFDEIPGILDLIFDNHPMKDLTVLFRPYVMSAVIPTLRRSISEDEWKFMLDEICKRVLIVKKTLSDEKAESRSKCKQFVLWLKNTDKPTEILLLSVFFVVVLLAL